MTPYYEHAGITIYHGEVSVLKYTEWGRKKVISKRQSTSPNVRRLFAETNIRYGRDRRQKSGLVGVEHCACTRTLAHALSATAQDLNDIT